MKNLSSKTCSISGYPGILLVGAGGVSLPTNVVRGGPPPFPTPAANRPPTAQKVAPGKSVSFDLSYGDVPVGTETSCPTSTEVEVTPPDDDEYGVVTLQIAPCGGGTIHVSPVYATG
jgi:hypothetical protein